MEDRLKGKRQSWGLNRTMPYNSHGLRGCIKSQGTAVPCCSGVVGR